MHRAWATCAGPSISLLVSGGPIPCPMLCTEISCFVLEALLLRKKGKTTPPGFEPGIPWFVVRCLIRWATGPVLVMVIELMVYNSGEGGKLGLRKTSVSRVFVLEKSHPSRTFLSLEDSNCFPMLSLIVILRSWSIASLNYQDLRAWFCWIV